MRIPTLTRVRSEADARAKRRGWRKKFAWLPLTVDTTIALDGTIGHRDSWIWLEPYMFLWGPITNRHITVERYTAYLLAAQEPV